MLAASSIARAADDGIPGSAVASAVLATPQSQETIDFGPLGSTESSSQNVVEPPLPPEAAPAQAATAAEKLPFVLDALMARNGRLEALGASDWRAAREAVRSLYVERGFKPIWTEDSHLNPAGRSLLAQLNRAGEDGLSLKGLDLPKSLTVTYSPDGEAGVEIALSTAAVVYALEATGARLVPQTISPLVTPRVAVANPSAALVELAIAPDPGERLAEFNPPQPGYRLLKEKLAEFLGERSAAVAEAPVVEMPKSRADGRARGRFAAILPASATPASFNPALAAQQRATIEANMEMWRWEPRDMGSSRIEINIPDYTLRLYQEDRQADEIRVIVGKPDTPTPVFSNEIKYLLINPIWRVPESIVRKEMLPKGGGDLSYLEQRGFKVKYVGGQIFVEQPPGEGNALGHLLFMFPNEHSVYLHDTPAHALFATLRRAYSHGCIRVEAPLRLASEVMGGALQGWSEEKVEGLYGPNERWVFLPAPLPIHIEYFTAFVDGDDVLQERGDIYGLTARVADSLSRLGQD
jgi:murein L,D-transpeptidase YcbB/YkuD